MTEGGEASLTSGSDIGFDFFCELCIDDNKQVEAEGYCVDCRDYLCEICYVAHKRTRSTRHHVLQDKSNMPRDTPLSIDRVSKDITTKCKVHSGEPVQYFCKSHAVLGCSKCFVSGHRGCSDIDNIEDITENIFESQVYTNFISKLQLIQDTSRGIEALARENKALSLRCFTDVVSLVRKLKEEAFMILNKFEQNTVTLAEQMMSEDVAKMESVLEDCKGVSVKIEQLTSEFESMQSSKRVCQLYINMRETEGEVEKIQENLRMLDETNVVRTLTFESNVELMSFLSSPDVLGTILHQRQQDRTPIPENTKDPSNITAKKLDDIPVRASSDTYKCCISGSAVVSNNRLIITDWNNYKVKLIDTETNKLLSELKLSSSPHDITVFKRNRAAVTLPGSKKIIMMKVSPTLKCEREITVQADFCGVAYSQDRLLVTFEDNPRLEIIDLRGNVIRTIENDRDGSKLFQCPWYVCVSRDGETIYVSDNDRNTVTSLTRDGVVKALYKDFELIEPRKVCRDWHGNVYVCGSGSKNVQIITPECKKIKVILTEADGLDDDVYSVSHCQDTNRLFIGMVGDEVKVYQLS